LSHSYEPRVPHPIERYTMDRECMFPTQLLRRRFPALRSCLLVVIRRSLLWFMCKHSSGIRLELPSLLYSFHEPSSCLGNLACCELLQKSRPAEPARSCLGSASEAHRLDPLYFSATVWGCPRARWGTSGVSPSRSKDEVWTASLHRIQWSYSRSLNMGIPWGIPSHK